MSIQLYTGTPGSGKSFHAAKDIVRWMKRDRGLICNFPVNEGFVGKKLKAHVEYWDNSELTAARLVAYALDNHKIGKEGQTLVVIDECQIIFNCRDFGRKDRNAWVTFFAQHRKLGFGGIILSLLTFGRTWFIAIYYWYGGNRLKLDQTVFPYRKRYSEVYDSYKLFSDMVTAGGDVCAGGNRASGGAPGNGVAAEDDREQKKALVLDLISVLRVRQRELAVLPAPRRPSVLSRLLAWLRRRKQKR